MRVNFSVGGSKVCCTFVNPDFLVPLCGHAIFRGPDLTLEGAK